MNKLATYLNQHLVGEVVDDAASLSRFSTDNSPLSSSPEMVVHPANTSDIRKLLRFSWQLAEKGHILPVIPRGAGSDTTGAATGDGVVMALTTHMNRVLEFDSKQRLLRLQPGTTLSALRAALNLQAFDLPSLQFDHQDGTIGGIVASHHDDAVYRMVDRLEVVLASGDVIQTSKLSKRELQKKKGQGGFEADIYREVDALLEENASIIATLDERDGSGYSALKNLRRKDGGIDLTPLFISSQGTLGVISELIIKAEYRNDKTAVVVASFAEATVARDTIDLMAKLELGRLEYYDGELVKRASETGKQFSFVKNDEFPGAILVAYLTDVTERARAKKMKRLVKALSKVDATIVESDNLNDGPLANIGVLKTMSMLATAHANATPLFDGAYIPADRFEEFLTAVGELAHKSRVSLPMYGVPFDESWVARPMLNLQSIGGKQAVLKLTDNYAQLVAKCGGYIAGNYAEGRLQSYSTQRLTDDSVTEIYGKLRAIFDPRGILNPEVKSDIDLKRLASAIRSDYAPHTSDAMSHL